MWSSPRNNEVGDVVDVLEIRLERIIHQLKVIESCYNLDLSRIKTTIQDVLLIFKEKSINNTGYSTNYIHTGKIGHPKLEISVEQLKYFIENCFSIPQMATMLNVSPSTIKRRLKDFRLNIRQTFTNINDEELDKLIESILKDFPNTGYKRMKGFLIARHLRIQEYRVRESMRRVDPEGVILRQLQSVPIFRRTYKVKGPLSLWHMDGNHKLVM